MEIWAYILIISCSLLLVMITWKLFKKQEKFVKTLSPGDEIIYNGRPGRIASMDDNYATIITKVPKMTLSKP